MLDWLKMFLRKKLYKMSDLRTLNITTTFDRKNAKILIIDDEDFNYEEELVANRFDIEKFDDIPSIESINSYDIVICDIKGIGKKFKSKYEGAHVIKEIKIAFPFKTVLAYSGNTYDTTYNDFFKYADEIVKKDIDLNEWLDTLDRHIKNTINVEAKWENVCRHLIDQRISFYDIALLEDKYVEQIIQKKDVKIESFLEKTQFKSSFNSSNVKIIVDLFKFVKGVVS